MDRTPPIETVDSHRVPSTGRWTSVNVLFIYAAIFLCFAGIVVILHHPGFHSAMVYDSQAFIAEKTAIFSSHDLSAVLAIIPARPLYMSTLYINYLLSGMDPSSFRWFNAIITAATATVLIFLYRIMLGNGNTPSTAKVDRTYAIAFFSALLFIVHPAQTFVVLYIHQREASLACFFFVSALAVYLAVRYRDRSNPLAGYVATSILFFAGMLSKENVATFPIILGTAELILFPQSLRDLFKRVLIIAAITVPPAVCYLFLIPHLHTAYSTHPSGIINRLADYYNGSGLTFPEVLMTESRVFFSYLGMILVPFVQGIELIKAETISRSLSEPSTTITSIVGLAALIVTAIGLARKKPLISFGIIFFFITLLPESLLIPQFLFFGNRTILPMVGVILVLGDCCMTLLDWAARRGKERIARWGAAGLALAGILTLAMMTYGEAVQWNPRVFWQRNYSRLPQWSADVEGIHYTTILMSYGGELVNSGDYKKAVIVLTEAVELGCELSRNPRHKGFSGKKVIDGVGLDNPPKPCPEMNQDYYTAFNYLGIAMEKQGDFSKALDFYRDALVLKPDSANTYNNIGAVMLKKGDTLGAVEFCRKALELEPRHAAAHNTLGEVNLRKGNAAEAINLFRKAIQINPGYSDAYNNLGNALLSRGNISEAIKSYLRGIALKPDSPELHNNLGAAYLRIKQAKEAEGQFRKAVELKPEFSKAWLNLGISVLQQNNIDAGEDYLTKAIAVDPNLAPAYVHLGLARELSGRPDEAAKEYGKALELNPNLTDAHYLLARLMSSSNEIPVAISHYQAVLKLNPRDWRAHSELGTLYSAESETQKAVEHLRKAVELKPDLPDLRKKLEAAIQRAESSGGGK